MKYIRTKDKIYGFIPNVVSSIEYDDEVGAYSIYYFDEYKGEHLERDDKGGHSMDSVWNDEIIKQADTIEELCDEYALISELEKRIIKPKEFDRDCEGWTKEIGIPEGIIKVYGSIWTDKGLIYVAKMNEKGELELL